MKLLPLLCALTLLAGHRVQAQELTPAEINKAVTYLEQTRAGVIKATQGLSADQWNFKPATNRWSIAEVTEHIAAAEDLLRGMIQDQVMKSPISTNQGDVKQVDALVMQRVPDRSVKAQAPEPLQPRNRFGSPDASLKHFEDSRAETIILVQSTPNLREHSADSPLGKKLDGYEWVLFIAAHSERHTKQIDEVKADPHFPKS